MQPLTNRGPDWAPLETVAPDELDHFMFMFYHRADEETELRCYKHTLTRKYLYLDAAGNAYTYLASTGKFVEIDVEEALWRASR